MVSFASCLRVHNMTQGLMQPCNPRMDSSPIWEGVYKWSLYRYVCVCMCLYVCVCVCRFMSKYHPTLLDTAKQANASHLCSRVSAFLDLLENGWLDKTSLSQDHGEQTIRTMDAGIYKYGCMM